MLVKNSRSYCVPAEPFAEFVLHHSPVAKGVSGLGERLNNEGNQFVSTRDKRLDKEKKGGGEKRPRSYRRRYRYAEQSCLYNLVVKKRHLQRLFLTPRTCAISLVAARIRRKSRSTAISPVPTLKH